MSRTASVSLVVSAILLNTGVGAQTPGPLVLPGAVPPAAETPSRPARPAPAQSPQQQQQTGESARVAAPVAAPLPTDVTGQKHFFAGNASEEGGELLIVERGPGLVGLHLKAAGRVISAPGEQCVIDLGGGEPTPMLPIEEPYRNSRYRLQSSVCPLVVEVLEHSVRVSIPDGECSFAQADCRLSPEGLWGPPGEELVGRTSTIERQRGRAERDMRDVSRRLLRRLSGDEQRQAAAEQAAFSSERATVCRNYIGEDEHGFCAAELTSARVEILKKRFDQTPERPRRSR
ncbi:hypothetical protein ACUSIJ_13455 [Pseudochelatococcus sp. B33]